MTRRRTIASRWRSLQGHVRHLIVAGALAVLGIVGTVVSDQVKAAIIAATDYVKHHFEDKACELRSPQKPKDPNKPVVLFSHFGNDPNDTIWNSVWVQLVDENEFEVIPSCLTFEVSKSDNLATAKEDFLRKIKPHIDAVHADMLLFGSVYMPYRARIWSATFLGGCDWQGDPLDLNATPDQVLPRTRSALLRVIIEGLIAACNREPTDDWRGVARIVDVVVPYLEKKKSLLTADDYQNAQLHVFALAYSRYSKFGEAPWFDCARNALNIMMADASAANDRGAVSEFQDLMARLNLWKYRKTNSSDALRQFVVYVSTLPKKNPAMLNDLLSAFDTNVISALQTALFTDLPGINKDEAEQALTASIDIAIKRDPKDADDFNTRCWVRAMAGRDLPLALADCDESLRLRPNNGDTLNSRGLVQYKLGAFSAAIADYSAALNLKPTDASSLFGRGMAKLKNGDISGNNDIAGSKAMDPFVAAAYIGYGVR